MGNTVFDSEGLTESLTEKVVVVDTSSLLLAGTELLTVIQDCVLAIPAIVVVELEAKRSSASIGFMAREWLNLLESLRVSHGQDMKNGVLLDRDVTIRVEPNHVNQSSLPVHLQNGSHDSTVLAVAVNLREEGYDVVLLSNDVPMRLHATLDLDMDAHEFSATAVAGAKMFNGRYEVVLDDEDYAATNAAQYEGEEALKRMTELILSGLPVNHSANAFINVVLASGSSVCESIMIDGMLSVLGRKKRAANIVARTQEQDIAMDILRRSADELPIVSIGGGAGTGKTLVTLAVGLDEVKANRYQKLLVFRSLHEMGQGQEMGFLPGGVGEKMDAWSGAVYDALDVIAAAGKKKGVSAELLKTEAEKYRAMVEVLPITYLRGRSLANTYIVLEEAQNFSRNEILNILSRAGVGSKVVLTFDAAQVDNRFLQAGKNADIWSVIDTLKESELFAHITLLKTQRSAVAELASSILEH